MHSVQLCKRAAPFITYERNPPCNPLPPSPAPYLTTPLLQIMHCQTTHILILINSAISNPLLLLLKE